MIYHIFDACNVQYDDFKSMIKDDKYSDKTKSVACKIYIYKTKLILY